MNKQWVALGEDYTWYIDNGAPEETVHRYEDGRTLRQTYPDRYKLVPFELAERLRAARIVLEAIAKEIDNLE